MAVTEGMEAVIAGLGKGCKLGRTYLMLLIAKKQSIQFHLELDGEGNGLFISCTEAQRKFVADFVAHMIDTYAATIEENYDTDNALRVHQIWSNT